MVYDLSKQLYDKYFNLTNRNVTVTLKDERKVSGVFVSFSLGDITNHEFYISRWKIVNKKDIMTLGISSLGLQVGEYIKQKDISEIQFHQDISIMKFNNYRISF